MLVKSVSAAIGVIMLPVLFSMVGDQDGDPTTGKDARREIASTQKEVTRWATPRSSSTAPRFFGTTAQGRRPSCDPVGA
jgi:hypothetical protein